MSEIVMTYRHLVFSRH